MTTNDNTVVRFSQGTGRNFGKATNVTKSWKTFAKDFEKPIKTNERLQDYLKLPDADQAHLKSVAGWVYRTQVDGPIRNRGSGMPSDIATFDFDYATPEYFQLILSGAIMGNWEWFLHTSRRHTPEKPRFRLFVLLKKPVPNDMYVPVSRVMAEHFDPDMTHVDKVSFRPAQMMFRPTISKDGHFTFHRNPGEAVDWAELLEDFAMIRGDWHDLTNLPKVPGEEVRETTDKAEDPTEKDGPVGDFCRAYSIEDAIEKFLPDRYAPVDVASAKPRYTYLLGTTTNGAEVQDGGLFLYSHHGSDPCSDMLVNAYDLVRIHLFGDKDKTADDAAKPVSKRPSSLAMLDFIKTDDGYRRQVVKSRYDMSAMAEDFTDEDVGGEAEVDPDYDPEIEDLVGAPAAAPRKAPSRPTAESDYDDDDVPDAPDAPPAPRPAASPNSGKIVKKTKRPPPADDWMGKLEMTPNGVIIANSPNIAQIIQNDLRLRDSLEFNVFMQRLVTRKAIKTKLPFVANFMVANSGNGDPVEDHHATAVRMMLESPNGPGLPGYGLKGVTDRDLYAALDMAGRTNTFHPVQEYLSGLKLTGKSVAESLFIDWLGCPDTPYYRMASKHFLIAAVARAFEPGCKFDFVPILYGAQGVGKSTFISILARAWFGELKSDFDDEKGLVEQMMGCWIMELPELSSIQRGKIEDVKAFVSARDSTCRLSYGRMPQTFPRQCVFMGSTNDEKFLIDATGNRRWWPINVMVERVDLPGFAAAVDQIWASAVHEYRLLRAEHPAGDLPLDLTSTEAREEAYELQEAARLDGEAEGYAALLARWLDKPGDTNDFETTAPKRRKYVSVIEAWTDGLQQPTRHTQRDARFVGQAMRLLGWEQPEKVVRHRGMVQRVYQPGPEVLARWAKEDGPEDDGTDDMI